MAFHLLAKPTGGACNLACSYCFFLSKTGLYPGSSFRMPEAVLDAYISQLMECQTGDEVMVAWQGGEPTLMGLDFFRRSVELAEMKKAPGQRVLYTIQTNATLIDDEWARFFRDNDFLVGVSMDGPRDLHDACRVRRSGKGSFDRVMAGLSYLHEYGVECNALATVHGANGDHGANVYRFLRDEAGFRFIQLIPVVERAKTGVDAGEEPDGSKPDAKEQAVTSQSVGAAQYGRFLVDVFEEWVRRDVGQVYVQMFDLTLANFAGVPAPVCVHAETCGTALALEHNGDLYSCDHFVEPEFRLGNILEGRMSDLVASERQQGFGAAKRDTLPGLCRACDVRFACHGGCPKDRLIGTSDGERGLNYLCDGYSDFFHHVAGPMQFMRDLLQAGRAPAEIVGLYSEADARRGRNDPCTCGSGRKWKHCHGNS